MWPALTGFAVTDDHLDISFFCFFILNVMNFGELLLRVRVSSCCFDLDCEGSRSLRSAENRLPDCTVSLPEHLKLLVLKVILMKCENGAKSNSTLSRMSLI